MRKLLKTLYVISQGSYLSLNNENVVITNNDEEIDRYPLITLESIVSFSRKGASVPLLAECAKRGIQVSFLSTGGRFLFRVCDAERGNVLLRREQYRLADNEPFCINMAHEILGTKIQNSATVIARSSRDSCDKAKQMRFKETISKLNQCKSNIMSSDNRESLRGIEGHAAETYYSSFNDMILHQKQHFQFKARSQRPPLDSINAMLSYGYTLLSGMCTSALETVGLDACVGFIHLDHVGRESLALDLMEELRAPLVDRFVLTLINREEIKPSHFDPPAEDGAVLLNAAGRKIFLAAWEQKKKEELLHPVLKEKVPWGLMPYAQAQLLARYIRHESPDYKSFHWR